MLFSLSAFAGPPGAGGDLYVGGTEPSKVVQFDSQTGAVVGDFVPDYNSGGLHGLSDLVFGPNGNLFVCSLYTDEVIEYDGTTGALIGAFASGGELEHPTGLVFGPNGNLFVSSYRTNSVIEFDGTTGAPIGTFASGGGLNGPSGLTFGPGGNLFVCSSGTDSVIEYDGITGVALGTFASGGGLSVPFGLGFGPNGDLFVASYDTNTVIQYERATGAVIGLFASGGLGRPQGLTFGPTDGNLYVASVDNNQVIEFDGVTGALVGTFASGVNRTTALAFKPFGGPFPAPDVTGLVPVATDNCSVLIGSTVTGTGLVPGAEVALVKAGEVDIPGFVTAFAADTQITANFYLGGVTGGTWNLIVTYPDGQSDKLAAALEVVACAPPTIAAVNTPLADNCAPLYSAGVTGTGLLPGAAIKLVKAGEPDIVGSFVQYFDLQNLEADFHISGAAAGLWDLVVTNPTGASATLGGALSLSLCDQDFTFYDLRGRPALDGSSATDVNNGGTVVILDQGGEALAWSRNGGLFELGAVSPPCQNCTAFARAIADDGAAFMTARMLYDTVRVAVAYTDGAIAPLPVPASPCGLAGSGSADYVNSAGTLVVGGVNLGSCPGNPHDRLIWTLEDGGVTVMPHAPLPPDSSENPVGVNNAGTVVIRSTVQSPTDRPGRTFLYQHPEGTYTEILGPAGTTYLSGSAINNPGVVVGWIQGTANDAFAYFNGALTVLPEGPELPQGTTQAFGVNDWGDAVGRLAEPFGRIRALLYTDGAWVDLDPYITPVASGAWNGTLALAINDHGWIVGDADAAPTWTGTVWWEDYPWLLIPNLKGDWDRDGFVTVDDFPILADCMGSPDTLPTPAPPTDPNDCLVAFDFDDDGDVDVGDFAAFQRVLPGAPPPTGACCLSDGQCVEALNERLCVNLRGDYLGDGSDCVGVDCLTPGACCLPGGTCLEVSLPDCATSAGDFRGIGTMCEDNPPTCPSGAYSNEVNPITHAVAAGAGLQLADDMTLEGLGARDLVSMDLAVFGHGGGDFDVTVSLYDDCPGNSGTLIPSTTFTFFGVPDDNVVYILQVDPVSPAVTIPDTVWMVVDFSTPQAAWIIAEQAETGITEDSYGRDDPWNCNKTFVCCYAGLWANLRCIIDGGGDPLSAVEPTRLSIERIETPMRIEVTR